MDNIEERNHKTIKEIIRNYWIYVAIVFLIVFLWFFNRGYLFFTDFSWGPNFKLNWTGGLWIINAFFKIFSFLPQDLSQKLFIALCLLAVLLGAKKIVENFISDKWLVFIVSLFALFNPFIYDRIMYGQFSVVLAFAFLCFFAGYLLEYLNRGERKQILLAGVFIGLMIQASMHFVFFGGAFYLLFILIRLKKKIGIKTIIKHLFFIALIVIGLNLNLFFGFFLTGSPNIDFIQNSISGQDLSAFQTSGKTGWEALKNVVMMSGFWGKDQFRYVDLTKVKEGWGRSFILLLPIIILGVYTSYKVKSYLPEADQPWADKVHKVDDEESRIKNQESRIKKSYKLQVLSYGLLILYVIAVILAVGIRLPVCRQITYWLFDYFPFYKGMREAQKWVAVIVVIYLIFLSIGVERMFKFKFIEDNKAAASILLAGIIIMQAPLMLWGLGGQVRPTQYPQDWQEVDEYIINNRRDVAPQRLNEALPRLESRVCDDRVLFLPWHMYMGFSWIGNVVANPAGKFFTCPVIQGSNMEWGGIYDNSLDPDGMAIGRWISSSGKEALPEDLDIQYIILAKEVDWKKYSWLDQIEDLVLIKETERLRLYEAKANNQ